MSDISINVAPVAPAPPVTPPAPVFHLDPVTIETALDFVLKAGSTVATGLGNLPLAATLKTIDGVIQEPWFTNLLTTILGLPAHLREPAVNHFISNLNS